MELPLPWRLEKSTRWLVVAIMVAAAWGSYVLFVAAKTELSPMEDRGVILVVINGPDGSTLEYTSKYVNMLEKLGRRYSEFDKFFAVVGNPTVAQGAVFMAAKPWNERPKSTLGIAREMMPLMSTVPGVMAFPITPPSLGQEFRERPFNFVVITGDSYENLAKVTKTLQDEIAKNPGIQGVDVDLPVVGMA